MSTPQPERPHREVGDVHVSTGSLPPPEAIERLIDEAHARFRTESAGTPSQVYPALAAVPAGLFGICVAGVTGRIYTTGDAAYEFTIMSVSKPFVFALICQHLGPEQVRKEVGVNGTGLPFNSIEAVERSADGRTNPMVNPGAIATTNLAPGDSPEERWRFINDGLSSFAGRPLSLDTEVYDSATRTNNRNRDIAQVLHGVGRLRGDPSEAVDLYTKQCSLNVTARDLAVMGATLANGGVNPITDERVVDEDVCHYTLTVMTIAGLYETSGDWLYDTGLPGKSGIGGGIVTVSPGKGGLGTFAPPLDPAGNSVKGQLVARFVSRRLGLDLFASAPYTAAGR